MMKKYLLAYSCLIKRQYVVLFLLLCLCFKSIRRQSECESDLKWEWCALFVITLISKSARREGKKMVCKMQFSAFHHNQPWENVIIQGISQNDTILLILLRLNSHNAQSSSAIFIFSFVELKLSFEETRATKGMTGGDAKIHHSASKEILFKWSHLKR